MPSSFARFQFGEFLLDPDFRTLHCGGQPVAITGKAFDLLAYMAANPGRPLLKEELLKAVWPDSFVEESSLSQNIFQIRRALGPDGQNTIQTLPGRGYLFAVPVVEAAPAPALTPGANLAFEATQTRVVFEESTEEHVRFWRSPVTLGFALLALVLLGVAGWLGWQRYEDRTGGPPVQVVLADPDGSTGDAVLDRTLVSVFRSELAQSPFVTILPGGSVREKLTQMQHKADDHLTPSLAREVCERSGSQAVVHGSLARAGNHFVLTEEATNCVDGASLGEATREVSRPDDLPSALARLASTIRHDLGESRRTIARFSRPLQPASTGSLEALKDLTEAERVLALGRGPEAVDLLKQAVTLDPNFASAWLDLSVYDYNNRQYPEGREHLTKAYNLLQYTTEPTRRNITARYNGEVTGDLYESLRNYQTWVDEYPRNISAWSGMTVVDHELGRVADELESAKRTMAISSSYQQIYYSLAVAQERSGDFAAALATLRAAIAKGFDGDTIRAELLKVGHARRDPALIAEQEAWSREHPFSPYLLAHMVAFAETEGRSDEADKLLPAVSEACRHQGNEALFNDVLAELLVDRSALGHMEKAKQLLTQMKPDSSNPFYLYSLEYAGEDDKVQGLLTEQLKQHPRSTKWNERDGPTLQGKLLLDAGKPGEALAALAPTRLHEGDSDAIYLRGLASLQLRQLPEAEAEFRKILEHPGIAPAAWQLPMANLQLARTLALEGRKAEAAIYYNASLTLWAHADPGQPLVLAARKELEALQHGG